MVSFDIDRLASELVSAVRDYTEDVSAAIERKVDAVAEEVKADAVNNAPKRKGKYAKGFKVTKQGNKRIIWNKKNSRLVHLLEFGHAKVGGGRVSGRAHLRPAYDRYAARLPDDIKQIIRNGG